MNLPITLSILLLSLIPSHALPTDKSPVPALSPEAPRCYHKCLDGACMAGCYCEPQWNVCMPGAER